MRSEQIEPSVVGNEVGETRRERAERGGEDRGEVVHARTRAHAGSRARGRQRNACSVGRNTLTSPDDGFNVPTTATTSSGQNVVNPANPRPVPTMTTVAAISSDRSSMRCAVMPKASVRAAEPSSVPVTIAPTSTGENPRWVRYSARSTLTKPSAKPRIARAVTTRLTSAATTSAETTSGGGELTPPSCSSVLPMSSDNQNGRRCDLCLR